MGLFDKWTSRDLARCRSEVADLVQDLGYDRDWFARLPLAREFFGEGQKSPGTPGA